MSYSDLVESEKVEPCSALSIADKNALVSIAISLKRIADTFEKSVTKSSDAVTSASSELQHMIHIFPMDGSRK